MKVTPSLVSLARTPPLPCPPQVHHSTVLRHSSASTALIRDNATQTGSEPAFAAAGHTNDAISALRKARETNQIAGCISFRRRSRTARRRRPFSRSSLSSDRRKTILTQILSLGFRSALQFCKCSLNFFSHCSPIAYPKPAATSSTPTCRSELVIDILLKSSLM